MRYNVEHLTGPCAPDRCAVVDGQARRPNEREVMHGTRAQCLRVADAMNVHQDVQDAINFDPES